MKQIVLCMPHRGRLNLLTGMLNFPPVALFHKLQGNCEFPDTAQTTGDVISHLSMILFVLKFAVQSFMVLIANNFIFSFLN